MDKDLAGKTALVTGSSNGIGKAIAIRLGAAGALVAVNYASDADGAADTVEKIKSNGGRAFSVQAKLRGQAEAERLAAALEKELTARTGSGGLDILVNNIGGGDYGPISEADEAFFDQVLNNNVRAPFFLTKALHQRFNDNGRVINISSAGARLTDPNIIIYTMAKTAVDAFTRVLAQDLGHRGITVNAVGPGFTAGPTNDELLADPETCRQITEATALKRIGQPEEIADVVYTLASPMGRWVTAQSIEASGGFRL